MLEHIGLENTMKTTIARMYLEDGSYWSLPEVTEGGYYPSYYNSSDELQKCAL